MINVKKLDQVIDQLNEKIMAGEPLDIEVVMLMLDNLQVLKQSYKVNSVFKLDKTYEWSVMLYNFLQDLDDALFNQRAWQARITYADYVMNEAKGFDRNILENAKRAYADSWFFMGDKKKSDDLFMGYLKENPEWGYGYIGWADLYYNESELTPKNLNKAAGIYKQAIKQGQVTDVFDVIERAESIFKRINDQEALKALETLTEWTPKVNDADIKKLMSGLYEGWCLNEKDLNKGFKACQMALTKDKLLHRCNLWLIDIKSTANKPVICKALTDLIGQHEHIHDYFAFLDDETLDKLKVFLNHDHVQDSGYYDLVQLGLVVPFVKDGAYLFIMPTEVKACLKSFVDTYPIKKRTLAKHVSLYITRSVQLYGAIDIDFLYQLYCDHHTNQAWAMLDLSDFYDYVHQALVFSRHFWLMDGLVLHESFMATEDDLKEAKAIIKRDVPYYRPSLEDLFKENDDEFRLTNKQLQLVAYLSKFNRMDQERLEDAVHDACFSMESGDVSSAFATFERFNVHIPGEKEARKVVDHFIDIYNHTRQWHNHGHSPYELSQVNQRVSDKVGRNEPCPCGSGKKYKKCCMLN